MVLGLQSHHILNNDFELLPHIKYKINAEEFKDSTKTKKLRKKPHDCKFGNGFLAMIPKMKVT